MVASKERGSLVDRVRRGERKAEEEVMSLIRSFARHICSRAGSGAIPDIDWEDVAQEASVRFFSKGLERFDSRQPEKPYVYAYVKHAYLHVSRTAWRRKHREEKADSPSLHGMNPEVRTRLHRILVRVSSACRELLQRLYFDGATYSELAPELGLKESSVRARASRCLANARQAAV